MKEEKSCRESRTDGGRVASFSLLTEASEIPWAWSRRSAELKWDYRSRDSVADTKLDYRKVWNLNMEESAPILLLTCLLLTPSFTPLICLVISFLCLDQPQSGPVVSTLTLLNLRWPTSSTVPECILHDVQVCVTGYHRMQTTLLFISQLQFVLFTHQTGRTHFICLVFRTGCWVFK